MRTLAALILSLIASTAHAATIDPLAGRVVQLGTPLVITGTATTEISARVLDVTEWISAAPVDGRYAVSIPDLPAGDGYTVEVIEEGITSTAGPFGVGLVIAALGQSNMAQWFLQPTAQRALPGARTWTRSRGWQEATGAGAVRLANALVERYGVPVGLIYSAHGGSALLPAADNGRDGVWLGPDETARVALFADHLTRSQASGVGAIVWGQGERDAQSEIVSRSDYLDGLVELFARLRAIVGPAPAYLIELGRPPTVTASWGWIRAAQRDYVALDSNAVLIVPAIRMSEENFIHFSGGGYDEYAYRVALAMGADPDPGRQYGGGLNEHLTGPILFGGGGQDTLTGGPGDDILVGGCGNDVLRGWRGNDSLYGEAGDDVLVGGEGDDLLVGGAGADRYIFTGAFGHDTISGFQPGIDVIEVDVPVSVVDTPDGALVTTAGGDSVIVLRIRASGVLASMP